MWLVMIAYVNGPPSTLKFDELDKVLAFVKDACQWMEFSKAVKVVIERERQE